MRKFMRGSAKLLIIVSMALGLSTAMFSTASAQPTNGSCQYQFNDQGQLVLTQFNPSDAQATCNDFLAGGGSADGCRIIGGTMTAGGSCILQTGGSQQQCQLTFQDTNRIDIAQWPEPFCSGALVPTEVPPTEVPPTEVPPTEVPPTEVPPTEVPPTEGPTQEPTEKPVDPTDEPGKAAEPTDEPKVVEVLPATGQGVSDGNGVATMLLLSVMASLLMLGAWVLHRRSNV